MLGAVFRFVPPARAMLVATLMWTMAIWNWGADKGGHLQLCNTLVMPPKARAHTDTHAYTLAVCTETHAHTRKQLVDAPAWGRLSIASNTPGPCPVQADLHMNTQTHEHKHTCGKSKHAHTHNCVRFLNIAQHVPRYMNHRPDNTEPDGNPL